MLGGEPMTEEQIHEAMRVLDTDRNGTIEYDEFQAWWDSDIPYSYSCTVDLARQCAVGEIANFSRLTGLAMPTAPQGHGSGGGWALFFQPSSGAH